MFKRLATLLLITHFVLFSFGCIAADNVSVAFSPNAGAEQLILYGIEVAEQSIKIAAYSFTSRPVSNALLEAYSRGVTVHIIIDAPSGRSKHSTATFLASQDIPVRLNSKYAIFHHKFMIIDDKHIQTGSFNYSAAAANRNAENVIILWDNPIITKIYADKWLELWDEAEPLLPTY